MAGKQIEIAADGGTCEVYLSAPARARFRGSSSSRAFSASLRTWKTCDDLARHGCVALAPNFFWRDQDSSSLGMDGFERAIARVGRIDFAKSMDEARRYLW